MKKTCKDYGSDGKGEGRACTRKTLGELVKACLNEGASEAMDCARSLCKNECEAEELVQEALYRVLRAPKLYDSRRPFNGWLLGILRNAFMDSRKRKERRDGVSLDWKDENGAEPLHETLADNAPEHLAELQRVDDSARVTEVLRRLPKIHQRVLRLCDMEGKSYSEAAQELGVPLGTIRSRLARARAALATAIRRTDLA